MFYNFDPHESMLLIKATAWYVSVEQPFSKPVCCTVKPVCNDHLYNEIYYLWFIQ